jgi:hypothetical protein
MTTKLIPNRRYQGGKLHDFTSVFGERYKIIIEERGILEM